MVHQQRHTVLAPLLKERCWIEEAKQAQTVAVQEERHLGLPAGGKKGHRKSFPEGKCGKKRGLGGS